MIISPQAKKILTVAGIGVLVILAAFLILITRPFEVPAGRVQPGRFS